MMLMFHECPKALFNAVSAVTDGDYALCHLLENDPAYARLFVERVKSRLLILDNSLSELGHSVPWDLLNFWTKKLNPTWVVLPDVDDNMEETIRNAEQYMSLYPAKGYMGVVKGKDYTEWVTCYKALDALLPTGSLIGISYNTTLKEESLVQTMLGRLSTIHTMNADGVINRDRRHHLLGCSLPIEVSMYPFPWMYSIDTSKPITSAMVGEPPYSAEIPKTRPKIDLMEWMDYIPFPSTTLTMLDNIATMRRWANA